MKGDLRTVYSKGTPLTLVGHKVGPGDQAPTDVQVIKPDLTPIKLSQDSGHPRLYSTVPSLDTAVCNKQTVTFNKMVGDLGNKVAAYAVSADLPFAQKRFAEHYKIKNMNIVSDYRDLDFGENYGLLIKEQRLLTRAVVVVGSDDRIKYMEIVQDTSNEPNYEKAMAALREAMHK